MLHSDYRFTCELSLEYSLTPSPLMGADGFPRMEAIPRCRTYARQMFDRFLLGGSDPFMYRMQDLWLDLYQAPWAIPQDKEQLLNDLSAKVASGELFIYLETDQLALGPGRYERSGPGAPPEPPEDVPRTSSTSSTDSASMSGAPVAGLPVADSGVNAGSAVVVPGSVNSEITASYTEVRFGSNGQVYAKLPAPSNAGVNRWQRMSGSGSSNRESFMGGTPGKESGVGLRVQDRMRSEGSLVGDGPHRQVLGEDGVWYPIDQTDMGHIESAVDYWNRLGRFQGARSPEVRSFMNNPNNYVLEPSSINRSKGASSGSRYLPEAKDAEKKAFFDIDDIE